ncbi:zinc finger and BTB domain-containing protein 17 isoform X1 [Solenopsis invicta]|uniref:zinc finger and BTB domain-containing protein 17 isoform X1 n=1 Tax=Solenopsis invicta TaxID=13686 RepID=UPI00193DCD96|nr:zinc finger and BTB domain-containing protein 17 isoform X1 [Solenopsis invicta]
MEDDQQFCLRWNNHQSTLIQNFDTLLESGTLVDCTLAAEGKTLKAHKVVLSACSPYFECLLSEHYDKHPVFILKDVKFKELKAMMDYMYRGEVNISQDQLAALLKAAESLQIKGLSESKTAGSSKTESRPQKTVSQPTAPSLDIPHASSGLTIEKNKVPRQSLAPSSVGDIPEDSASPQVSKGLSSREGSQSPTSRKRKRPRRRSLTEETIENQDASNSSDMPQQMGVPALGIAPVADEKVHADPTDSLGRSALMTQLTKPADEMLQLPLEKPEPNDNLIEPKSEYLDDAEEGVEDLTLDEDMNDLNDMEQDNNRAGPSHDPAQHPAGLGSWHVTGDRSNAGGVVGSVVAGAPGTTDEVFLQAQEAAQAHRDSQVYEFVSTNTSSLDTLAFQCGNCSNVFNSINQLQYHQQIECGQRYSCLYKVEHQPNVFYHVHREHPSNMVYMNKINDSKSILIHKRNGKRRKGSKKQFPCGKCSSVFNLEKNLSYHQRAVCGRLYKCSYCTYQNKHPSTVRAHVRMKHPVTPCSVQLFRLSLEDLQHSIYLESTLPKRHFCLNNCGRSFETTNSMMSHLHFECFNEPQQYRSYSCYKCGQMFMRKSVLRAHLSLVCDMPMKFKCPYCSYQGRYRFHVKFHVRKKHPSESINVFDMTAMRDQSSMFYCRYCNYRSEQPLNVRLHTKRNHPTMQISVRTKRQNAKSFHCSNCGSGFVHKPSLRRHKSMCGQPPQYKCPYCVYMSKDRLNVRRHIGRIHPDQSIIVLNVRKTNVPQIFLNFSQPQQS